MTTESSVRRPFGAVFPLGSDGVSLDGEMGASGSREP